MTTASSSHLPESVRKRLPGRIPADRIRTASVPRHPVALGRQLMSLPDMSSAVADALDELGRGSFVTRSSLAPVGTGHRVAGPAVTLRYVAVGGDPSANRAKGAGLVAGDRDLYGVAEPGDVAVVDCSGVRDLAVLGGLSAAWAARAGLAGCVVDGAVRDGESIRRSGLAVWAADRSPRAARYRIEAAAINDVVMLAGVPVRPGDYIVADDDGLCVVPFADFPEVLDACFQAQRSEEELLAAIAEAPDIESLVARTRPGSPD